VALLAALVALIAGVAWLDRQQAALLDARIGPSRAGLGSWPLLGLLQPLADALKLGVKRSAAPARGVAARRHAAALASALLSMLGFALLPWGGSYELFSTRVRPVVADPEAGVLASLALLGAASLAPLLGVWAGASGAAALGALRSVLQWLAHQTALATALLGPCLVYGSLNLTELARAQQGSFRALGWWEQLGLGALPAWLGACAIPSWGIALQPLAFGVAASALAVALAMPPFGAPRARELGGGWLADAAGSELALYRIAGLAQRVVAAGLLVTLFLGGWSLPWVSDAELIGALRLGFGSDLAHLFALLLHAAVFGLKLGALLALQGLARWQRPSLRPDQVLRVGWGRLAPLALLNLGLTGAALAWLGGWRS
jgi:NADH-quinone oxidoreductase subunit H